MQGRLCSRQESKPRKQSDEGVVKMGRAVQLHSGRVEEALLAGKVRVRQRP